MNIERANESTIKCSLILAIWPFCAEDKTKLGMYIEQ